MKEHFCPVEKELIGYEGVCNWCGEKENTQQRTWVGLTTEDLADCILKGKGNEVTTWKLIEAKLKEKNNG